VVVVVVVVHWWMLMMMLVLTDVVWSSLNNFSSFALLIRKTLRMVHYPSHVRVVTRVVPEWFQLHKRA